MYSVFLHGKHLPLSSLLCSRFNMKQKIYIVNRLLSAQHSGIYGHDVQEFGRQKCLHQIKDAPARRSPHQDIMEECIYKMLDPERYLADKNITVLYIAQECIFYAFSQCRLDAFYTVKIANEFVHEYERLAFMKELPKPEYFGSITYLLDDFRESYAPYLFPQEQGAAKCSRGTAQDNSCPC